jgi:hypothetical protein
MARGAQFDLRLKNLLNLMVLEQGLGLGCLAHRFEILVSRQDELRRVLRFERGKEEEESTDLIDDSRTRIMFRG